MMMALTLGSITAQIVISAYHVAEIHCHFPVWEEEPIGWNVMPKFCRKLHGRAPKPLPVGWTLYLLFILVWYTSSLPMSFIFFLMSFTILKIVF